MTNRRPNSVDLEPTFRLPNTVDGVIKMLDEAFPLRSPRPDDTLVVIQRHAGARDVVDMLRSLQKERNDEMLS